MIQTENLTKRFNDFLAVDAVSLEVKAGEVLALLGPNGAGKTTTLRMLTSVLKPSAGWARVAGFDVVTQSQAVRARVGILTEQHGLYGRMTAVEYLDFYGQIYHMPQAVRRNRTRELLEQYGLSKDAARKIGEYSKGMRQKLALARALFHDPPVLFMDEPTSAMDPESARLVRDAILGLRSANRAIIICTHNLAEAEELATKIAIIHLGRIIIAGETETLKTSLLGAPQYEVNVGARLVTPIDYLPPGVELSGSGADWLRFRTTDPLQMNPRVVECLVDRNIPVVGLAEVKRSLESAYLEAISAVQANGMAKTGDGQASPNGDSGHVL
jgi:ABC-2 type transport system ATP-binding protein